MNTAAFRVGWVVTTLLVVAQLRSAEGPLDRVDEQLSFSSSNGNARGRLSGSIDLEAYRYSQPAPGLIDSDQDTLLAPRLTLFSMHNLALDFMGLSKPAPTVGSIRANTAATRDWMNTLFA